MRISKRHSAGFTLVELLVVMAVMALLAGIGFYLLPTKESRLANQGADQLQTFIASSRARAMRDNQLSGVRLISLDSGNTYTSYQFIQSPPNLAPLGALLTAYNTPPSGNANPAVLAYVTISGNIASSIAKGDLLLITAVTPATVNRVIDTPTFSGGNTIVPLASIPSIASVTSPATLPASGVIPASNVNAQFSFVREPRPLMGETELQLPQYVRVNNQTGAGAGQANGQSYTTTSQLNVAAFSGQVDIIFSPSGQVVNATAGRIILWVDDQNLVSQPTLLCIYARTGGVAAQPVATGANPYSYTQDGSNYGQ